jgi:energy-coupling factor transporter transmembrane protein EcfT
MPICQTQFNETHPYRSKKEKEMNTTKESPHGTNKSTTGIDPRVKLSLLWIFVVLNMAYADILSLMDPTSIIRGIMLGAPLPAGGLILGAIVMETSFAMIILPWVLNYKVNRWVSIIIGVFMSVQIVVGGHGLYYAFFATVEVACILLIICFTWKWNQ